MKCKIPGRHTKFEGFKIPAIKKWVSSLKPKLKEIPDPRGKQGRQYPLDYVLQLYFAGCLAGYFDCYNCVEVLKKKQDIISEFIPEIRKFGIPSHDCFCDILAIVSEEAMRELLKEFIRLCRKDLKERPVLIETTGIDWIKEEEPYHKNGRPYNYRSRKRKVKIKSHTCIDGKASRGAADKKRGRNTPYTGGFYDATAGYFTDIVFIPNGKEEGEATLMRQALLEHNLSHEIITADALHTSTATMEAIRDKGGEFLLRLKKGSHSKQFEHILQELKASKEEALVDRRRLESASRQEVQIQTPALDRYQEKIFTKVDKARCTKTTIKAVIDNNNVCSEYSPHIAQIISLKTVTTELIKEENSEDTKEITSSYECCFVSSCILDIEDLYRLITQHWSIESAHWVLDNYLKEDRSTGRTGHQIFNRALLKRLAFNLLKILEKCVPETQGKSTGNKFIFLREYFELALMLVGGFDQDYGSKMARVYEKRKEVYLKTQRNRLQQVRI